MKNILTFIISLFAVSVIAAPFQQNRITTNSDATVGNTLATNQGPFKLNRMTTNTDTTVANTLATNQGPFSLNRMTTNTDATVANTLATNQGPFKLNRMTTNTDAVATALFLSAPVATNWFVLTNGSDANAGTASNSATAFRTIQKAINTVASYWYTNITPVTIQLGPGIYNENVVLLPYAGNAIVTIGNETNASIAPSSGDTITAAGPVGGWTLSNVKLWATNGSCIASSLGASVVVGTGVNFATANAANYHMLANNNGAILIAGNYTVSGGARNHYYATRGSVINSTVSPTLTISGTPAFNSFAACDDAGVVAIFGATFNGSTTGKRFDISLNGVMHTLSGSATYFPGNASGTTNSGAQYQ
jgi:hypothetical protein